MVYFSSVCLLDCALLSFLTVPALNFLLNVDKATLYHTVPFISSSFFFSNKGKGVILIANGDCHSQKH